MANTLTNVNDTKIMSDVVAALKLGLTPLRVFSLGVGDSPIEKNQFVNVPVISLATANSNATNYENGNNTIVSVQVNVNTNLSRSWHMTAVEASKTSTDAFSAMAVEATYAVCYAAQLAALDLITHASYNSTTALVAAATAMDSDKLFDIRNTCTSTLKWRDTQDMSLVLLGSYYANLCKDPAVKNMSASGNDTSRSGNVVRHAGFNVYENNVIASAAGYGATGYLRGFACLPQAMALAIRPPAIVGQAGYEVNEIVSDPEGSGLSLNFRRWISTSTNTHWGAVEVLFGGVACDAAALYRIVSQTSS